MTFLRQGRDVSGPGEVTGDVCSEELEVTDPLHYISSDVDRGRVCSFPAEVNQHFLGFGGVEGQVVCGAPGDEFMDVVSVSRLIVVVDEPHYCSVVSKFDKDVVVV